MRELELPKPRTSLQDTYLSKIQKLENQDGSSSFFKVSRFLLKPETVHVLDFLEHLQANPHPHLLTPEAFNGEEQQPLAEFYPMIEALTMSQAEYSLKRGIAEGRLNENDIVNLMQQLASALTYIHELGFVHRDVRMENIFLQLVEAGLGLTLFDYNSLRRPYFQTQKVESWSNETPPEVRKGNVMVDARFDVYAVGYIFHKLTHEFESDLPISPLNSDHPIFTIIQKAKAPLLERYRDASGMHKDISALI